MKDLLNAGVHFGHQKRYWNPQMEPYIFGVRNKIHIIDLQQTLPKFQEALNFIGQVAANNGTILFVGTKKVASDIIAEQARRCGMPFVSQRWLGGMLTNFKTIKQSINRLKELESGQASGGFSKLTKKEGLMRSRELDKLNLSLGGIKDMQGMPDVMFVLDVRYERTAIKEAKSLSRKIPVVAVVDTNCTTNGVNYVIPGNDDAFRAVRLYVTAVADAIIEGRSVAMSGFQEAEPEVEVVTKVKEKVEVATKIEEKVEVVEETGEEVVQNVAASNEASEKSE